MEAADEKLTALKKAYADVILNISKEAAARVMASEKKSMRYQHELKVTKDEGVRMLMRLKQMMDSQIIEAEAISLNQQKKIEELEAQLQEAEDIVKELREELGEVQDELERLKSENSNNLNESNNAQSEEVRMENKVASHPSCKYLPPIESSVAFDSCSAHVEKRELPSIIARSKDPGLYRNGCTQRIHACGRNLLDKDLCLLEENREVKDEKNVGEQKKLVKVLSELEKKLLADINFGDSKSFSKKRKRAVRRRKIVMLGGKSCVVPKLDRLIKHSVTSDPTSANGNVHSDAISRKRGPVLSQDKAEPESQLSSEKGSEYEKNIMEICGAKTMEDGEKAVGKVVPLMGESGSSEGLLSPDYKMDIEKVDVPSHGLGSNATDTINGLTSQTLSARVIKYTYQRKRKRQAFSESEMNGSGDMEKKMGDGQNGDQKLEIPTASLLKKSSRVRRQCGSEVNGSHETVNKTGEGKNGDQKMEQPKPSSLKESSRDRRRLAQVARQLLSLSEKKWWD